MRIFKYIYVISFFLPYNLIFGQETEYFNKRFELTGTGTVDHSYCIIDEDNSMVTGGYSFNQNNTRVNMVLSSVSYEGQLNWVKTYGDSVSDYLLGRPGCIIRYSDNQFYSIGYKRTFTSNWEYNRAMLTSYNQHFDTLWTQYFGESMKPYDTSYIFSQLKKTSDNNLILGGEWMPYGGAIRMCLIKTDTSGNMLWKKSYGSGSGYFRGYSVIETSDKGYALGGFLFYIGQDESGDPIVVKTDSLGNQQWMKYLGGYYTDHIAMLTNTNDGNFIAAYSYADTMLSPYDPVSRICITKMDNQGNILWSKFYGAPEYLNFVNNIKELEDGSLIVVGRTPAIFPAYAGWLLKTSSNGDSIWYRQYKNLYGEESRNRLYDVIETSDNGLAACGYLRPVLPDTGDNDTWIIKLDSNGCDTPGCDPTVAIPVEAAGNNNLHIYPNPAGDRFTIESSRFINKEVLVSIYDLFGRKVKEIKAPKGEGRTIVNSTSWHKGLYFVKICSVDGFSESVKLIIK